MPEAIAEAVSQLATKADLAALRPELRADIAALRAQLDILKRDITIRLRSMIVIATGVFLAAKYFG